MHRDFHEAPARCVQQIRDVVPHQRAVVLETACNQQVHDAVGDIVDRRPIPSGRVTYLTVSLKSPVEPVCLLFSLVDRGIFMEITVVPNLMPVPEHGLDHLRILLNAPTWYKKGLFEAQAPVGLQNAWDCDHGTVLTHRDRVQPVIAVLRSRYVDQTVSVHVEGDGARTARAVRPLNWVLNHRAQTVRIDGTARVTTQSAQIQMNAESLRVVHPVVR